MHATELAPKPATQPCFYWQVKTHGRRSGRLVVAWRSKSPAQVGAYLLSSAETRAQSVTAPFLTTMWVLAPKPLA
jgi:hypothetical protein